MLLDAGGPDRAAFERSFDICVIGSGPAGMTLARSLAAQGLDVALMEGGALELTPESQDVYVGANVGLPYHDLDEARVRMFGGSSYHWTAPAASSTRAISATGRTPRSGPGRSARPISTPGSRARTTFSTSPRPPGPTCRCASRGTSSG